MNNRLRKLLVTVVLVGTIIGSTSALSYAAGFYNGTSYTIRFGFVPPNCPWAFRYLACGYTYEIPPHGSISSNNTPGYMELGGHSSSLLKNESGYVYTSFSPMVIEVGNQDAVEFTLEGWELVMRIYRRDGEKAGTVEVERLKVE